MHNFHLKNKFLEKTLILTVLISFICQSVFSSGLSQAQAQQIVPAVETIPGLPQPGAMVGLSPAYDPVLMIGMKLHPEDPFRFDFMVHPGDDNLKGDSLRDESSRLIKYFFAAMTVPEDEMWVNLSPYEKDRIIPQGFGATEIGRDLLAQDYLLKQLTASLMYPEKELGRTFWKRVKDKTREKYGTNEIPMETFHKVWIIPDRASVYVSGTSVFVTGCHHKVMLENDYLALEANQSHTRHGLGDARPEDLTPLSDIAKEIIREIIIPEIEREVNTGKSFAHLRQISNAVILATWYKRHVAGSVLQDIYTDHNRTAGVDTQDKQINQKIYQQYLKAFQQGVYNFIKEDYDEGSRTMIPRKYFSGGVVEKYEQISNELQLPDKMRKKATDSVIVRTRADIASQRSNDASQENSKQPTDSQKSGALFPTATAQIRDSLQKPEEENFWTHHRLIGDLIDAPLINKADILKRQAAVKCILKLNDDKQALLVEKSQGLQGKIGWCINLFLRLPGATEPLIVIGVQNATDIDVNHPVFSRFTKVAEDVAAFLQDVKKLEDPLLTELADEADALLTGSHISDIATLLSYAREKDYKALAGRRKELEAISAAVERIDVFLHFTWWARREGFHPATFNLDEHIGYKDAWMPYAPKEGQVLNDSPEDKPLVIYRGANMSGKTFTGLKRDYLIQKMVQTFGYGPFADGNFRIYKKLAFVDDRESSRIEIAKLFPEESGVTHETLVCLDEPFSRLSPEEHTLKLQLLTNELLKRGARVRVATHNSLFVDSRLNDPKTTAVYHFKIDQHDGQIVQTHQMHPGPDDSHALEVARDLGLPEDVVQTAQNYHDGVERSVENIRPLPMIALKTYSEKQREILKKRTGNFYGFFPERGWLVPVAKREGSHPSVGGPLKEKELTYDPVFKMFSNDMELSNGGSPFDMSKEDMNILGMFYGQEIQKFLLQGTSRDPQEIFERQKMFGLLGAPEYAPNIEKIETALERIQGLLSVTSSVDRDIDWTRFNHELLKFMIYTKEDGNIKRDSYFILVDAYVKMVEMVLSLGGDLTQEKVGIDKELNEIYKIRQQEGMPLPTVIPLIADLQRRINEILFQKVPPLSLYDETRWDIVRAQIDKVVAFLDRQPGVWGMNIPGMPSVMYAYRIKTLLMPGDAVKDLVDALKSFDSVYLNQFGNYFEKILRHWLGDFKNGMDYLRFLAQQEAVRAAVRGYLIDEESHIDIKFELNKMGALIKLARFIQKRQWTLVQFHENPEVEIKGARNFLKSGKEYKPVDFLIDAHRHVQLYGEPEGSLTREDLKTLVLNLLCAQATGYAPNQKMTMPVFQKFAYYDDTLEYRYRRPELSLFGNNIKQLTEFLDLMTSDQPVLAVMAEAGTSTSPDYQSALYYALAHHILSSGHFLVAASKNPDFFEPFARNNPAFTQNHDADERINNQPGQSRMEATGTAAEDKASIITGNQGSGEMILPPSRDRSGDFLEKYIHSIGEHAFLPMFREILSSMAKFPDTPGMNYEKLAQEYTHVHTDSDGNAWGYIPIRLNEAGQAFFGTFSDTERPVASQRAFLITFNSQEGNYGGKFDTLHNLPMALVVEDPIQDKNILFDISFLWSYPGKMDWILKNAQDVINKTKLATFKDWSGLILSPENTQDINASRNVEGRDQGYKLSLLTVKPYTEQKTDGFLQEVMLDALPHEKIFSARHNRSADFQKAVIENAGIFKNKTVRVQGPGTGIDVLLALLSGARRVTYYDINPAHNLLTAWNVRYARDTGQIPIGGEVEQSREMGDADVYLFNAPAVYNEEFLAWYLRRRGFSYNSRAYYITPGEFIMLFNELKEKLAQNKNSLALWRIIIGPSSGLIDDIPEASYEMRIKEFLKKNNLVGDPVEGILRIANDAAFYPNLYLFHAAKNETAGSRSSRKDGEKKDGAMNGNRFIDGLGGVPVSMPAEEIILALRAKRGVNNRSESSFKNEFYAQSLYKKLPDDKRQLIEDIIKRYGYEVVDTVAGVRQWREPFFTTNGGMPFDGYSNEEYLEYFPELGLKLIQSSIENDARQPNVGAELALSSLKTLKPYLIHSREDMRRILDELENMYWTMAAENDLGRDVWGIWEIAVDVFDDKIPQYWDDLKEFAILSAGRRPGQYFKFLPEVKKIFGHRFFDEIGDIFKLMFKEPDATSMGYLINGSFMDLKEHYGESFFEYWPSIKAILLNLDSSPHNFIYYQLEGRIGFHGASLSLEQLRIFAEMSSRVHGRVATFWNLLIKNNIHEAGSLNDFRQGLEQLIPLINEKKPDLGKNEKTAIHKKVEEILKTGKKNVLLVHNLDEGLGDEIIRNGSLVQALLDYNPELEIYVYTKQTQLYNHPRIKVTPPFMFDAVKFDMIIHRYDADRKILSQRAEDAIQDVIKRQQPAIYIHSPYAYGRKGYDIIRVGNDVLSPINDDNQYAPTLNLLKQLGLPHRSGNNQGVTDHYMTTVSGSEADQKIRLLAELAEKNIEKRPVVFLNPFGGELTAKGLSEFGFRYGARQIQQLIESGFFVILMPNMNHLAGWGFSRSEDEKSIMNFIPEQYLNSIMLAPVPQPHERGILYLMEAADIVGTVEGGITHLAYALGKHYVSQGFVGMDEDGYDDLSYWISSEHSTTQRHYHRKIYMAEHIIEMGQELGLIPGEKKDYSAKPALDGNSIQPLDKGGIDLNPRNTELHTGGDEICIRFPEYRRPLPEGPIPGLIPVIMDIQPVTDLPALIADAVLPVSSRP